MKHECKITVLETKYFQIFKKNILLIRNQDRVHVLRLEIHFF